MEADCIMTVQEVALELRCSKPHVYNAIAGKVSGVSPLPAISMGPANSFAAAHWRSGNARMKRCPADMLEMSF
jgi:hypothetical protein